MHHGAAHWESQTSDDSPVKYAEAGMKTSCGYVMRWLALALNQLSLHIKGGGNLVRDQLCT